MEVVLVRSRVVYATAHRLMDAGGHRAAWTAVTAHRNYHTSNHGAVKSLVTAQHPLTSSSPNRQQMHYRNYHQKQQFFNLLSPWSLSTRSPWFLPIRSFSSQPLQRIPSNLTIDSRSSYAPKKVSKRSKERDVDFVQEETNLEENDVNLQETKQIVIDKKKQENVVVDVNDQQDEDDEDDEDLDEDYDDDDDDDDDGEGDEELFLNTPEVLYAIPLPDRLHVPVKSLLAPAHNNEVGTIWLDESVFGCDPIRVDIMKKAVNYWRAKRRGRRKAKTKTISERSGSGRKLRPQKGQGRARVGHSRAPHFRGGAKAHGPKNTTNYGRTKLNKKVRRMALRNALSQKLLEGNLIILNQLYDLPTHKTKELAKYLEALDIGKFESSALILDSYVPDNVEWGPNQNPVEQHKGMPINFWLASNNIPRVETGGECRAVVYYILKHEKLVLTLAAVERLEQRLKV